MEPEVPAEEEVDLWELVSGGKSLTAESVNSILQGLDGEEKEKGKEEKEEKEDWYTTLPPATPANTPEYTPIPPSYPSATLRKDLSSLEGDLFPIKELLEDAEDISSDVVDTEISEAGDTLVFSDYSPAESEIGQTSYWTLKILENWICRFAAYLIVVGLVKWVVFKVWGKLKSMRAGNEIK